MVSSLQITHVIFDFDGVLVDSEQIYSEVNSAMLAPYGKEFTLDLKVAMMGTKKSEAVALILTQTGLIAKVPVEEYMEKYDKLLDVKLQECPELPGASKIINHLSKHKIPMGICTGSDEGEFVIKTHKNYQDWLKKIPLQVLCGTDPEVEHGKPSPDPYIVTMRRMTPPPVDPKNVLVFEDSLNGAISALAAGCNCVMIPQFQFLNAAARQKVEEIRPRLAEMLTSLDQFDPTKYGLPAFD